MKTMTAPLMSAYALPVGCVVALGLAFSADQAAAQSYGGHIEARAVYADGDKLAEDEEDANRSAFVLDAQGDARWIRGDTTTRLTLSSTYHAYEDNDRDDRWNNEIGLSHQKDLSPRVSLTVGASLGSEYSTLEYRSADQIALDAEVLYSPSREHRFGVSAAYRYREYDNAAGNHGHAPYVEGSYRYRPSNRHRLDLAARLEAVDSDNDAFDLTRQRLSGHYTFTPDRQNRIRVGVVGQNWEYDSRRLSNSDERLHRWRIQPQVRYTREFEHDIRIELDYRLDLSRSNDPSREEDGNRFTLSLRKSF